VRSVPFRYERATIEVETERQDHPPRVVSVRYELTVVTDEPARRLELLHRNIEAFGTIYNTLAASADVSGTIRASPSAT
jgi:hypothetical protein